MARKLNDCQAASKILDIPIKNLKRWIKQGHIRKKGGRKTLDPQMESDLRDWIHRYCELNSRQPNSNLIKKMAKKLSNFPERFKASKGWYEKFTQRFNCRENKGGNFPSEDEMIIIDSGNSQIRSEQRELDLSFRSRVAE